MRSLLMIIASLILEVGVLIGLAGAENATDTKQCWNYAAPPRERIDACTAVIGSAGETPQALIWGLIARGDAFQAAGELDRAREDYEEALRRLPEDLIFYPYLSPEEMVRSLGGKFVEKGAYEPAIKLFEKAIRLSASDEGLMTTLDADMGLPAFRISQDGRTLELSGKIWEGPAREFERFLATEPAIRLVRLRSTGGYDNAARRMAQTIERLKLDTAVFDKCLSACADVYLAGRERIIGPEAEIGFHRGRSVGGMTEEKETPDGVAVQMAGLRRNGLSEAFARRVVQTKHDDMWSPSHAELLKERVATRVATTSEAPSPTDRQIARERKATEFLLEFADQFHSQGDVDRAVGVLDEILRRDPHDPDALRHRAEISMQRGDLARALADWDAFVRLDPQSAYAFYQRGAMRAQMNDLENASRDIGEALRLDPEFIVAYLARGLIHYRRQEYDRAIEAYDAVLRLVPEHSIELAGRVLAQVDLGDYDRALEGASRLLLSRQDAFAFHLRGFVYSSRDEYSRAIEDVDHAIRLNPAYAIAWGTRCSLHVKLGRLEAARSDCDEALRLAPDSFATRFWRGVVRLKLGAFDEAFTDFDAVVQHDLRNEAHALYGRGLVKLKKGDLSGGKVDIAAAKAKRPSVLGPRRVLKNRSLRIVRRRSTRVCFSVGSRGRSAL